MLQKKKEKTRKKEKRPAKKKLCYNVFESDGSAKAEDTSDEDFTPKRLQVTRHTSANKRIGIPEKLDSVDYNVECQEVFKDGNHENLLRYNKCKKLLHASCSIYDDSCIN